MQFKFRLTDLLFFTAYFAIGAWLVSLELTNVAFAWMGTAFGLEIGKRSDHSTFLITLCGSVMGLGLGLAVFGTRYCIHSISRQTSMMEAQVTLTLIAWGLVLSIFWWLCFRVRRKAVSQEANR